MVSENKSYLSIFKSTFLFSFVQVFNIIIKIGINKSVAILLGAEGMGIIGLFNTAINLVKTGGGFGISQSAIRDISEANASQNEEQFSKIISVTNKLILITGLFGIIITIVLSPWLSLWSFGHYNYTFAFILLSVAVGLNIFTEGQLAILKGMRQLRALAKASILGSFAGLVTSVPLFYFFGNKGIVASLIIVAVTGLFFSHYFVKKISYKKHKLAIKTLIIEAKPIVKMGTALMWVTFIGIFADLFISSYISRTTGLEMVGYYQAGATIITGYFGIIITAMATDYYPRISAIHNNNELLQQEVNKQSEVGLVMALPLVVIFLFISPLIIKLLYSNDFMQTIYYTDIAVMGAIIMICSNSMGMILLAKQKSNIFIFTVTFQRVLMIIISLVAYNYYELKGMGISYAVMAVIHLLLMSFVMKKYFNIKFKKSLFLQLLIVLIISIITLYVRHIDYEFLKYTLGLILMSISIFYSIYIMNTKMEIDIFSKFKRK